MSENKVAILMGSKSDLPVMTKAADFFKEFGVNFEMQVMSAHRSPKRVAEFASQARANGYQVLIGGAGMAAHLAGALAAHSDLPVIGVPLDSGQGMGGMDALLATAQMPKGVPVATVAVNGAMNAACLAIQILGLQDAELAQKYSAFREKQGA
ncbi:5-(carboxyamino)imidazole ribonucleotide mutase [bacterium K02(2017)]|nr:5-(carboxyamino)imidazole ribonucleotide mutase [bacterium K02(2017)]